MKNVLMLIAMFGGSAYACATTIVIPTPEYLLKTSDLIALVDIAEVHSVETPEKIILQSAVAKLIDVAWRRDSSKLFDNSKEIIIYTMGRELDLITDSNIGYAMFPSVVFPMGKALVCLVRGDCGPNTYRIEGQLSFQHLNNNGKIQWRNGQTLYQEYEATQALQEIKDLVKETSKTP